MPRVYRHIEPYQEEILKLKEQGLSHREIGEKLGFSKVQIKEFFKRFRRKEQKISAGIVLKKKGRPAKGRPAKGRIVTETDKINELKYIITRKDARIKSLEMQNELMRDFLLLTERK